MVRMLMLAALALPAVALAVQPQGAFAPEVEGMAGQPLVAADGRLLAAPNGARLHRLADNRWFREAAAGQPLQWFDDRGQLLAQRHGRLQYGAHWQPPVAALDEEPLWHAWIDEGQGGRRGDAVVDARGQLRLPVMEAAGAWEPLPVAGRAVWQGESGVVRIHDLFAGRELLRLDGGPLRWVGGPFHDRDVFLLCQDPGASAEPCVVRDGAGEVLFGGDIDALRPTTDGGWWLRQRDVWRRVDARGRSLGPERYQQTGPGWMTRDAGAALADVPLQGIRYARGLASTGGEPGWMLGDGTFAAFPGEGQRDVVDYCPGRWLLRDGEGAGWIIDARARVLARADGLGFSAHPRQTGWRLRTASAQHGAAVLDCDGNVLFEQTDVHAYRAVADGLVGELTGEQGARLWLDAQLRPHLLDAGLQLQEAHIAPPLLLARDGEGQHHLYNTERSRLVARNVGHPAQLFAHLLVYLDAAGRHGVLRADGEPLLDAVYAQVQVIDNERFWTRQPAADGSESLVLHDLDGRGLVRRRLAGGRLSAVAPREGGASVPGMVELTVGTLAVGSRLYFVRQWLDRDGRALVTAVQCPAPGDTLMAQGPAVLHGHDWTVQGDPAAPCIVPAALQPLLAGKDSIGLQ